MKESSTQRKVKRDKDFAQLLEPTQIKPEKIVLVRPIYHTGRQYLVKLPREIADKFNYKKGDALKYTLVVDPQQEEPSLQIEYVRQDGRRTKR